MHNSPVGPLYAQFKNGKLARLSWQEIPEEQGAELKKLDSELSQYFKKNLQEFDFEYDFSVGTPFQQKVWRALCDVPYGQTVTYGELAKRVGTHARAIGGAMGANPIPILVPCHRVVGANKGSGGYSGAGGMTTKQFLLELEGALD